MHVVESQTPSIAQAPLIAKGRVAQRFEKVKVRMVLMEEDGIVEVCWGLVQDLGMTEIGHLLQMGLQLLLLLKVTAVVVGLGWVVDLLVVRGRVKISQS